MNAFDEIGWSVLYCLLHLSIIGGEKGGWGEEGRERVKLTLLVFVINLRFNLPFRHTAMFHCSLKNSFRCI